MPVRLIKKAIGLMNLLLFLDPSSIQAHKAFPAIGSRKNSIYSRPFTIGGNETAIVMHKDAVLQP